MKAQKNNLNLDIDPSYIDPTKVNGVLKKNINSNIAKIKAALNNHTTGGLCELK